MSATGLDLPLESYAAGIDEMIGKIAEMRQEFPSSPEHERIIASFEAMNDVDFTMAELRILLAIALDRMATP